MSRCGSCPLYWPDDSTSNYGVTCEGDQGVEECADKLQDLVSALQSEVRRLEATGVRELMT